MNQDPLHELLHAADAAHAPASVESTALVQAVRRRAHRRQTVRTVVRRGALGASLVLLAALGIWRGVTTDNIPVAVHEKTPPAVEPLRSVEPGFYEAEIARLNAEIERNREMTKLLLLAMPKQEKPPEEPRVTQTIYRRPAADFDSLEELVADRLDTAARISVQRADTLAQEFQRFEEAAEAYRAVIHYFPKSRWATVAQERLDKLQPMN